MPGMQETYPHHNRTSRTKEYLRGNLFIWTKEKRIYVKNILKEKPLAYDQLHGRCKYCCDIASDNIQYKQVLDIGCGYGWFLLYALGKAPKAVCGVDNTLQVVGLQDDYLCLDEADARHLPWPNETFDTIVCWDVIEHLPKNSEKEFFAEASRVLKPGGRLYLSTPYSAPLTCVTDPAWWLIGHRHYSFNELKRLYASWFFFNKHEVKGGFWDMLGILNMYVAKWIFRRESFFKNFFDKKTDEEYSPTFKSGFMTMYVELIKR
jgi:SAM-dependent methyltransferase